MGKSRSHLYSSNTTEPDKTHRTSTHTCGKPMRCSHCDTCSTVHDVTLSGTVAVVFDDIMGAEVVDEEVETAV